MKPQDTSSHESDQYSEARSTDPLRGLLRLLAKAVARRLIERQRTRKNASGIQDDEQPRDTNA